MDIVKDWREGDGYCHRKFYIHLFTFKNSKILGSGARKWGSHKRFERRKRGSLKRFKRRKEKKQQTI